MIEQEEKINKETPIANKLYSLHSGKLYFNLNASALIGFSRGPVIGHALHYYCSLSRSERLKGHVRFSSINHLPSSVDADAFPLIVDKLRSARFVIPAKIESQILAVLRMRGVAS